VFESNNFINKSIIIISIVLIINFIAIFTAQASTQFEWTGTAGYSIKGSFSYDSIAEAKNLTKPEIEQLEIPRSTARLSLNSLNSLSVKVYDPDQQPVDTYTNVVDGKIFSEYFKFNYNPAAQKIFGQIDLGGQTAGEIYLKGTVDQKLFLIEIDSWGKEQIIDQNNGLLVVN
jgi:hypothetical protein